MNRLLTYVAIKYYTIKNYIWVKYSSFLLFYFGICCMEKKIDGNILTFKLDDVVENKLLLYFYQINDEHSLTKLKEIKKKFNFTRPEYSIRFSYNEKFYILSINTSEKTYRLYISNFYYFDFNQEKIILDCLSVDFLLNKLIEQTH
jgi:hypothetical protein